MLTETYIEALLVDEELADQVWDAREIDDLTAYESLVIIVWSLDVVLGLKVFCYEGSSSLTDCSGYSTAPNHRWTPITPALIRLLKLGDTAELAIFVIILHRLQLRGHNALKFGTIDDGSSHHLDPHELMNIWPTFTPSATLLFPGSSIALYSGS